MVPVAEVQAPDPIWYSPPVTLIGAGALIPVTVRLLDNISVLRGTLGRSEKLKKSGEVSGQGNVLPLGELEIGDAFGTSSNVFKAKK